MSNSNPFTKTITLSWNADTINMRSLPFSLPKPYDSQEVTFGVDQANWRSIFYLTTHGGSLNFYNDIDSNKSGPNFIGDDIEVIGTFMTHRNGPIDVVFTKIPYGPIYVKGRNFAFKDLALNYSTADG